MTDRRKGKTRVDDALDDILTGGDSEPAPKPKPEPPTEQQTPKAGDHPPVKAGPTSVLKTGDVRRTVYVPPDDWAAVLDLARWRQCTASDIVREALRRYLDDQESGGK